MLSFLIGTASAEHLQKNSNNKPKSHDEINFQSFLTDLDELHKPEDKHDPSDHRSILDHIMQQRRKPRKNRTKIQKVP